MHRIVPIVDSTGKVIHYAIMPLMVELRWRDVMQIIVGASILAIPVTFTEEAWVLGETLPLRNVFLLLLLSLLFIASFVYFNMYRHHLRAHTGEYVKRVLVTYLLSFAIVGLLLTIIGKCPWGVDNVLALKRVVVVALPASMSATVSDTIK